MPTAFVNGVNLYYEVTGKGFPLVWGHEFAGSYKSWEPQVKFFSRRYQVITYNARGWPPSDVPVEPKAYSWEHAVEDLYQLLRHLGIEQAYIGGLSMGGYAALMFGINHPEMAKALIIAAAGSGAADREGWVTKQQERAQQFETEGMETAAKQMAHDPNRIQLMRKDPKSWQEYYKELASHSATGSALTMRGFVIERPSVFTLETKLKQLKIPALILTGDEDELCIEPALFMKRNIPHSGLVVFPQSGHVINVEETELFNRVVLDFLTAVEAGGWA